MFVENGDTIRSRFLCAFIFLRKNDFFFFFSKARAVQLSNSQQSQFCKYPSVSTENISQRSKYLQNMFDCCQQFLLAGRPYSMSVPGKDDVEELVNACLDTSGIDRRYSAVILEELRDCTNLTPDEMREAAHEITTTLGSNSPQYASFTSSVYDSAATRITSSDERLFDSTNHFPNV